MFDILWSLLNITLLVLVVIGAIKVGKLIKEKWGARAMVLFAVIILTQIGKSSKNDNYKNVDFRASAHIKSSVFEHSVALMKQTLAGKYSLDISYGRDTLTGLYVPLSAEVSRTGFFFGNNWKPGLLTVNTSDDNRSFSYTVTGLREWYFLGAQVYSENEDFSGKVIIKPSGK